MTAYVIAHADITDETLFNQFSERVPGVVAAHGGRFLVRSGDIEVVQGEWNPERIAIVEFDDIEQARAWQESAGYAELRQILNQLGRAHVIIVPGYDQP
ncbi:MAG: DUF1330 domain-containing protein [Immundisolibacterales bacterium]|nr:DUF1330 domain-containing protein [Immundisolibacterales bacterium]